MYSTTSTVAWGCQTAIPSSCPLRLLPRYASSTRPSLAPNWIAYLGLPEGFDGVIPEDLLHQVGGHLWPTQRQVDRPGEAGLGVRVVCAEHEEVIAEVIRDHLDHLAAFM